MTPYFATPDGRAVLYQCDVLDGLRTLPDASVDLVFTDPPYGHNNQNGDLQHVMHGFPGSLHRRTPNDPRPIDNDGPEATDLLRATLPEIARVLKPGCCCCCCCGGGGPDPQFARWSLMIDEHLDFKQMVVWDKGPMGMGWHYRRSYETILVAMKPGAACAWYDTTNRVENVIRHVRKIIPNAEQHPTEKPADLAGHFILLHSQPGDLVLDCFCGSGSTGVAAVHLGRRFVGIELSAEYVEMSERRLARVVAQGTLPLAEPEPASKPRQETLW